MIRFKLAQLGLLPLLALLLSLLFSFYPASMKHSNFRGPDGQRFTWYKEKMAWKAARAFCASTGGRLAVLDNQVLNDLVYGKFPTTRFWLGASDEQHEGSWEWINGKNIRDEKYHNWRKGQPNGGTKENCLLLIDGDWIDVSCEGRRWPLCELSLRRLCTIRN